MLHLPTSSWIPCILALMMLISSLPAAAQSNGGFQGLQGGWAVDESGNVDFLHSLASGYPSMQTAKASWVRIHFRLGACFSNWTGIGCNGRRALDVYDEVVDRARAANLRVLGLLSAESWHSSQSEWIANNAESTPGSGDNAFVGAFAQNAGILAGHFAGRVEAWEVWNEPNAWTFLDPQGNPRGGFFMYPSNFAWLMRRSHVAIKVAAPGAAVISGGIFGHDIGGASTSVPTGSSSFTRVVRRGELVGDALRLFASGTPQASCVATMPSGADYLCATYDRGRLFAGWTAGAYPLDHVGQHLYVDQGSRTSTAKLATYLNELRAAYVAYEGPATPKHTQLTEIGWPTNTVSESDQAANLHTTFAAVRSVGYAARGYWFLVQDIPEADLYYGIVDGKGVPKPSFAAFQQESAIPAPNPSLTLTQAPSPTRTATASVGPSASPTASAPPAASPTASTVPLPSTTRTPTPTVVAGPGGRGFALQNAGAPLLTWSAGIAETGYRVIRWSPTSSLSFLPGTGPLPPTATGFADGDPLPDDIYCYMVAALGNGVAAASAPLALSDLLCLDPHSSDGAPPTGTKIQLNQSAGATLSWNPVAGATSYQVVLSTFDGRAPRSFTTSPGKTLVEDNTTGVPTCYSLRVLMGTTVSGVANTLCAIPGGTTLGAAGGPLPRL